MKPSPQNDARLVSLDFLHEAGHLIASFALAIASAAAAERLDVLEIALRQCRAALLEAIVEFKAIEGKGGGDE